MKVKIGFVRSKSGLVEQGDRTYVESTGGDYTWYGMRIDVSSAGIKGIQLGTTSIGLVLERCKTGNPGFSIYSPLYVPTYVQSY